MGITKIDAKTAKWYLESEIKDIQWVFEHRFHPKRRWRFDMANIENKIAIEIEGGIFSKGNGQKGSGAHSSVTGILRDIEKYNNATALGWRVIRVVPTVSKLNDIKELVMAIKSLDNGVPL